MMPAVSTAAPGIAYRELHHWKYQLWETYSIMTPIRPDGDLPISTDWVHLGLDGHLLIKAGYAWDGCSGPTWDDLTNMRGGLVHDALYGLLRLGLLSKRKRLPVDDFMVQICLQDGMWKVRASIYHAALVTSGGFHTSPRAYDKLTIRYAPARLLLK